MKRWVAMLVAAAAGVFVLAHRSEAAEVGLASLLGAPVVDRAGTRIARVEDMLIGARSHRIVRILAGTGAWIDVADPRVRLAHGRVIAPRSALRSGTQPAEGAPLREVSEVLAARVEDWNGLDVGEVRDVVVSQKGRILRALIRVDDGILRPGHLAAVRMPPIRQERVGSDDLVLTVDRRDVDDALRGPDIP